MSKEKRSKAPAVGYPEVEAYPECSECFAPYVLRRVWLIEEKGRTEWAWQRDCKHRHARPKIVQEAP